MDRKAERRTPISFPFKKHECGYCGLHNHNTEECYLHFMDTIAQTEEDMVLFERLGDMQLQALEEGKMMFDVPEAVDILASIGMQYER